LSVASVSRFRSNASGASVCIRNAVSNDLMRAASSESLPLALRYSRSNTFASPSSFSCSPGVRDRFARSGMGSGPGTMRVPWWYAGRKSFANPWVPA
jgi:hypothetical protein